MAIPPCTIFHGHGGLTRVALEKLLTKHYLKRKPPMTDTFEVWLDDSVVAVLTFGVPASRHLQTSACPEKPDSVVELNRLWIDDKMPKNFASWLISRCLKMMNPMIVVSYADTSAGHEGFVYRASNFKYAGWSDMDRKTPRFDYVTPGKHSRSSFRDGMGVEAKKIRRKPKVRYWTVSGSGPEKKKLQKSCGWPTMSWQQTPPPFEHLKLKEK